MIVAALLVAMELFANVDRPRRYVKTRTEGSLRDRIDVRLEEDRPAPICPAGVGSPSGGERRRGAAGLPRRCRGGGIPRGLQPCRPLRGVRPSETRSTATSCSRPAAIAWAPRRSRGATPRFNRVTGMGGTVSNCMSEAHDRVSGATRIRAARHPTNRLRATAFVPALVYTQGAAGCLDEGIQPFLRR